MLLPPAAWKRLVGAWLGIDAVVLAFGPPKRPPVA